MDAVLLGWCSSLTVRIPISFTHILNYGCLGWARTSDQQINSLLLYLLSYKATVLATTCQNRPNLDVIVRHFLNCVPQSYNLVIGRLMILVH